MPHATLKLAPGVDQNRTLVLNEAAISSTQLVRFVPDRQGLGLVQKLGGWTKFFSGTFLSTVRALWPWEDTNNNSYLGVGCENRISVITSATRSSSTVTIVYSGSNVYSVGDTIVISGLSNSALNGTFSVVTVGANTFTYTTTTSGAVSNVAPGLIAAGDGLSVINSGNREIITPRSEEQSVTPAFTTISGSPDVLVAATGSNIDSYDAAYLRTYVSVGGLVLFGVYPTVFIDGTNNFQIEATNEDGSLAFATSSVTAGGAVPVFAFTSGTAVVSVTLANHGFQVGDVFTVLVPVVASGVTLYGNYTVSKITSTSVFEINANNSAKTLAVTAASWSGGSATLTFSGSNSLASGDTIVVASMIPTGYNGTYAVTAATSTTVSYTVADPRITISNATWSTGTVTITHSGGTAFSAGQSVIINSINPSGYNGTYTILTAVSGSFTYALSSNPGAYVSSGYATVGGTVFASSVRQNGGNANFVYYKTPGALPASTGYGVGGYGAGGYGTGAVPAGGNEGNPISATDWTLDNWGEIFISNQVGGPIFSWIPGTGATQASLIPQAPMVNDGMFVAMPQRQIIAWGSTFNGIQDQLLVRWCDVNDYNQWTATLTNQAGSYRIPKGSKIVGCIQGPQQGLLWTDLAIWAMQYVGPPYVYQFNEIGNGCGLIARKAAASMNGIVYWMGQSQFYRLGGGGVEIIRCPIWDVIFQDLDTSNLQKIRVAPNSRFGEISWYYPTSSNGGEVSHYVKYNVALDQWDFGALARTAWINESVLGAPIGAGPTDPTDEENFIYQHETSKDADGLPMTSSFQTGYFAISDGEMKMFVDQVWPDMKWGYYNGSQDADLALTFYVADYPSEINANGTTNAPRVYGPYTLNNTTEFVTPRFRGRLVSIKMESSDAGSFWRLGAMRYRVQQDGKF